MRWGTPPPLHGDGRSPCSPRSPFSCETPPPLPALPSVSKPSALARDSWDSTEFDRHSLGNLPLVPDIVGTDPLASHSAAPPPNYILPGIAAAARLPECGSGVGQSLGRCLAPSSPPHFSPWDPPAIPPDRSVASHTR